MHRQVRSPEGNKSNPQCDRANPYESNYSQRKGLFTESIIEISAIIAKTIDGEKVSKKKN